MHDGRIGGSQDGPPRSPGTSGHIQPRRAMVSAGSTTPLVSYLDLCSAWDRSGITAGTFDDDIEQCLESACGDPKKASELVDAISLLRSNQALQTLSTVSLRLLKQGLLRCEVSWFQTIRDLDIVIGLPKDVATRDIVVAIKSNHIKIGLHRNSTLFDGDLFAKIDPDDCSWLIDREANTCVLKVTLAKRNHAWWIRLLKVKTGDMIECQDRLSPDMAFTLACELENCRGDPEMVYEYMFSAANSKHALAASRVGNALITGEKSANIAPNPELALKYLMIAAEGGLHDCMFQVAHAFQNGICQDVDFDKAVFWYKMAADGACLQDAMFQLGLIYHHFDGRVDNPQEAFKWWSRAADHGHPDSMFNLGLYYHRGTLVEQNLSLACELLTKATQKDPALTELLEENSISLEELRAMVAVVDQMKAAKVPSPKKGKKN